jgi:hypothetical protein
VGPTATLDALGKGKIKISCHNWQFFVLCIMWRRSSNFTEMSDSPCMHYVTHCQTYTF